MFLHIFALFSQSFPSDLLYGKELKYAETCQLDGKMLKRKWNIIYILLNNLCVSLNHLEHISISNSILKYLEIHFICLNGKFTLIIRQSEFISPLLLRYLSDESSNMADFLGTHTPLKKDKIV